MKLGSVRRALFALYQLAALGEKALAPQATVAIPDGFLSILEEVAGRLRSLQGAAEDVQAGAAIAINLSSANPVKLLQGCTGLKTALTGPDFGLALLLAPSVREMEATLAVEAEQLGRIIGGVHRLSLPPSVRHITHTAQILEQQPVPLGEILTVMQRRRYLLIPETQDSIHTRALGVHTIDDIFSGRLEKSVSPAVENRNGGADSVALGAIAHFLYSARSATNMMTAGAIAPDRKSVV